MKNIIAFVFLLLAEVAYGQIGYQVSLINNATGETRANETVNVTVELSYEGGVLLSETKSAKTNDFGVLSLSVGDATTFQDFDWNKLPLYISATVDGILVGKSQILTVPVAQHALHTGTLTKELLCSKTWVWKDNGRVMTFKPNEEMQIITYWYYDDGHCECEYEYFDYYIVGDHIFLNKPNDDEYSCEILHYIPVKNVIVRSDEVFK